MSSTANASSRLIGNLQLVLEKHMASISSHIRQLRVLARPSKGFNPMFNHLSEPCVPWLFAKHCQSSLDSLTCSVSIFNLWYLLSVLMLASRACSVQNHIQALFGVLRIEEECSFAQDRNENVPTSGVCISSDLIPLRSVVHARRR